jgi:hypothetical protein
MSASTGAAAAEEIQLARRIERGDLVKTAP